MAVVLPAPFSPKQREDDARRHAERDVVERGVLAVTLGDMGEFDDGS